MKTIRSGRRRALLLGVAAAVLAGGAVGAWQWRRARAERAPAPPAALALSPVEARLLAAAARAPANPQPYDELGEEYAGSSRLASALWAYSEATERAPADGTLRLRLADCVRQLGYPAPAEAMLRSVIGRPGDAAGDARRELADLLLATGRPGVALAVLKGDSSEATQGAETDLVRGRAAEAAGDPAAAERLYRRAGAAGDVTGFVRLARLELAAGRPAAARQALQALIATKSTQSADLLLVAQVQEADGTRQGLNAALQTLLRAAQQRPRDAEVYYQAALIFLKEGDRRAALAQLERAVLLDPQHAPARGQLAELLAATGQVARAHRERAAYEELLDQPDRSLLELQRAKAAGYAGDVERTLMAARTASELEQLPTAVKEAEGGLKRHPGDPNLMLQLGLLYQNPLGASRPALEKLCRDWRTRDPASGRPYWLLGKLAVTGSRLDEAIRLFRTACAMEPNQAEFCTSLGAAYLAQATAASVRQARPWLEKAVELDPRLPTAHRLLGDVLQQEGDPAGARRQYLQSVDLQPDQAGVYNNLAQVSARLNNPEAVRIFADLARSQEARASERKSVERRVRMRPDDGAARLELARLLIRDGQLEAARNQLERAAEPGPAAAQARAALAQVERLLRVQSG